MAETSYQVKKFYHFAIGEGWTSFSVNNRTNFLSE